jgi:small subunit ribosomal protein S6
MPYYESVMIARQDLSSAQVDTIAEKMSEVLSSNGAKITKRENWGLKNLAYKMKKNRKGHYVFLNIDGNTEAVAEYERQMRYNEDILRYMTVKVDELDNNPSVVVANEKDAKVVNAEETKEETKSEEGEE